MTVDLWEFDETDFLYGVTRHNSHLMAERYITCIVYWRSGYTRTPYNDGVTDWLCLIDMYSACVSRNRKVFWYGS